MSHTGKNRFNRAYRIPLDEIRPRRVIQEENVGMTGTKDGDVVQGEFKGSGDKVLVGLSTDDHFDDNNIFNDDQKGIAIGFSTDSVHFCVYSNDGAGSKLITEFPKLKDNEVHQFEITVTNNPTIMAVCKLDNDLDNTIVLTTKIPLISDSLQLISYGVY